jgi:superfamily II RNA helicase
LRGDNELWLALALQSGEMDDLDPHHLATVCAALVTENSRPDSWVNLGISPTVEEVLTELHDIRRQLFQIQRRHLVAIPIWLDYDLVGLIEQWAWGWNGANCAAIPAWMKVMWSGLPDAPWIYSRKSPMCHFC